MAALRYMARWPDAGFLTTSDHLGNTTDDDGLETHNGIHSAFNIGGRHTRPPPHRTHTHPPLPSRPCPRTSQLLVFLLSPPASTLVGSRLHTLNTSESPPQATCTSATRLCRWSPNGAAISTRTPRSVSLPYFDAPCTASRRCPAGGVWVSRQQHLPSWRWPAFSSACREPTLNCSAARPSHRRAGDTAHARAGWDQGECNQRISYNMWLCVTGRYCLLRRLGPG